MGSQVFTPMQVDNDFAALGAQFSTAIAPQPLNDPQWVHINTDLAQRLGLDLTTAQGKAQWLAVFSGQQPMPGGQTIAAVYSGHQFGVWAGQLGDGRAHLLGRVVGPQADLELQLKGSGRTPYSRMGDGRAVLRSSIREYLCSHAMQALGVPTTEALALLRSQDPVYREQVETAAIVVRTAPTFLRFGSYEHWHQQPDRLATLVRYTLRRFFPHLCPPAAQANQDDLPLTADRIAQWYSEVVASTAKMIAHWQVLGFCHGVMNTDNMSILGLTIDYGPYAFMDEFHYAFTPNTTDRQGRYAWYQQPPVAFWNLSRLGSALTHLGIEAEVFERCLAQYETVFWQHYQKLMRAKLGLVGPVSDERAFLDSWWKLLHDGQADVTLSFRKLTAWVVAPEAELRDERSTEQEAFYALFAPQAHEALRHWLGQYRQHLSQQPMAEADRRALMNANNPLYILRNHLAQRCIAAAEGGDYQPLAEFFAVLSNPFIEQPAAKQWAKPPTEDERVPMLSCSS